MEATFPTAGRTVHICVNTRPEDDAIEAKRESHMLEVTPEGLLRPLEHEDWGAEAEERIEFLKVFGGPDSCVCQRLAADSEHYKPLSLKYEMIPEKLWTCAHEICEAASRRMCWVVEARCNERITTDQRQVSNRVQDVSTFSERSQRPQKMLYTNSLLFGTPYHKAVKSIYLHMAWKHKADPPPKEFETCHLVMELAVFPFLSIIEGDMLYIGEDGVRMGASHFGWWFPQHQGTRMWWAERVPHNTACLATSAVE